MGFASFVEGPLLWVVLVSFLLITASRLIFFISTILRSNKQNGKKFLHSLYTVSRALLPYHKGVLRRPVYTVLRYAFHICLFTVPIWLSGHVVLWEESRFGWSWMSIPAHLADGMTLLLLGIAAYLLMHRISLPRIRRNSTPSDYLLVLASGLPFLTGYFLAHGTLDGVPFLSDHMRTTHVLTGEALLIVAMFLFYRTHFNAEKCTGCASCVVACPTKTLASRDEETARRFFYLPYQCIGCAACVAACPENAAELIHEMRPRRLFHLRFRETIRSVALAPCKQCGTAYAPEPQMEKTSRKIHEEFVSLCPSCRMLNYGEKIRKATGGPRFLKR